MTKSSTENDSSPEYSTVANVVQGQTAILITKEPPRPENDLLGAVLTENNQQERKCYCSGERVCSAILVTLILSYLSWPLLWPAIAMALALILHFASF